MGNQQLIEVSWNSRGSTEDAKIETQISRVASWMSMKKKSTNTWGIWGIPLIFWKENDLANHFTQFEKECREVTATNLSFRRFESEDD